MTDFRRLSIALGAWSLVLSAALPAAAQDTTFSLDRLRIAGAPDDGVGIWRPQMGEKTRIYGQFHLGYAYNPFRIENHLDSDRAQAAMAAVSGAAVRQQLTGTFNIGVELFQRLGFQVLFPLTFFQNGNPTAAAGVPGANDAVSLDTAAPGDLRVEARGVIYQTDNRLFKIGANAFLNAPTGNEQSFTGDKTASGGLGVATELDFRDVFFTLDTGVAFRPKAGVNDFNVRHEWTWGLGAYIPLRDDRARIGLSIFGSTGIGDGTTFDADNTPLEWAVEGRFALDEKKQFYVGGNGGTRLTPGYAPDFRLGAFVGYWLNIVDTDPPAPTKKLDTTRMAENVDTDKDGYPDNIDLCPTEPEDGKPPFTTDGCPAPKDRDGDGIPDGEDKCPDVPEDKDGVDDKDGCPEEDPDKDGIPDAQDKCPKEPGEPSKDPAKNGCPQFIRRVEGSSEIQVLKRVEFEFGSARLSKASFPILDEVYKLLNVNTDITMLAIEGHTDNVGADELNLKLSKDRARSCLDYLVQKGIAANRLSSEGFGETKPIASNDTADGRQTNRRVEFHIKGGGAGATGNPTPKPAGGPGAQDMPTPGAD